jgi:hypothetical protein
MFFVAHVICASSRGGTPDARVQKQHPVHGLHHTIEHAWVQVQMIQAAVDADTIFALASFCLNAEGENQNSHFIFKNSSPQSQRG